MKIMDKIRDALEPKKILVGVIMSIPLLIALTLYHSWRPTEEKEITVDKIDKGWCKYGCYKIKAHEMGKPQKDTSMTLQDSPMFLRLHFNMVTHEAQLKEGCSYKARTTFANLLIFGPQILEAKPIPTPACPAKSW